MMRNSTHFTFNGISSEEIGVQIASPDAGLFEEAFLPTRTIIETRSSQRDKPYFKRVVNEPLSFPLTIFISNWNQSDNLRQLAKWLFQDYYKPFYYNSNPERIYYAIVEGDSALFHNGLKEGYITLNFRCDSPYSYSRVITYDLESSTSIYTNTDLAMRPKLKITKTVSDGTVSIRNISNDTVFSLSNLKLDEVVHVDSEYEEITSSLQNQGVYRYDDHDGQWLLLEQDENYLEITGDCTVSLSFEEKYLAE